MKKSSIILIFLDWLSAVISWSIFFVYRKRVEIPEISLDQIFDDDRLGLGLLVIPLVWLFLWWWLGTYEGVFRKSRIQMLSVTLIGSLIGALGLLFTVIRDDLTLTIHSYLLSFLVVFVIHWILFSGIRLFYLSVTKWMLARGIVSFKAIRISDAESVYPNDLLFTRVEEEMKLSDYDPSRMYHSYDTIIVESKHRSLLNIVLPSLIGKAAGKMIVIDESSFEYLDFEFRGTPSLRHRYITLKTSPIWSWQRNSKRILDILSSIFFLIVLSPLFIWLGYKIKIQRSGSVLFRQSRIGRYGKPFTILKFRSMYENAEDRGPALAVVDDDRCTPFGKWMRRWRLDELPQFFNVLKGDMSLVGPRPERMFFAQQLIEKNPRYSLLWQVRPGITSWGQIKYGYASSLTEMLTRFRYDLLYIEHMSILLDFRILYYTLLVLWQGRGR